MRRWSQVAGIVLVSAVLLGVVVYAFTYTPGRLSSRNSGLVANAIQPSSDFLDDVVMPEGERYRHERLGFSFTIPEGFAVHERAADDRGGETITVENATGEGVQLYVTPFDGDIRVLSAEDIRRDIPDMQIADVQTVDVGPEYRGVAFMSDNEAFGGASREVWFVFRGNLYQISTYAALDNLLKQLFSTWQFE